MLVVFLVACKPATELQQKYIVHFHLLSDLFFEEIVEFEKKIDAALRGNKLRQSNAQM